MKRWLILILAIIQFAAFSAENIRVFFSPKGGCTEAVVENVGKAKTTILVQAYSFTSAPIANLLM